MAVFSFYPTHTSPFRLIPLFIILFTYPILIHSSNPDFFDSQFTLYGDAALVNDGSSLKLTNPSISSSGMVMYQKGFKFDSDGGSVSFSAHFSFSISPENGNGVVFLLGNNNLVSKFPGEGKFGLGGVDRFVGVEFGNRVGIYVSSLIASSVVNASDVDLVLKSGKKLESWIDYDAGSKRIEVRLCEFGSARPYDALVRYSLDLGKMWKGEDVYAAISGSSGNSTQISSLYSCKYVVRDSKNSMHSQPLDPSSLKEGDQSRNTEEGDVDNQNSRFCLLSILAGLIFTTGCGALMAFVILFLWVVFVDRHRIQAEPDFKYENINVIVETDMDVVNK